MTGRIDWGHVLIEAEQIVDAYDTGVTLRQLFYRLVAAEMLPNTINAYKGLSSRTAEARRSDTFPALIDRVRGIQRPAAWDGPAQAMGALTAQYRRDRTEGQDRSVLMRLADEAGR